MWTDSAESAGKLEWHAHLLDGTAGDGVESPNGSLERSFVVQQPSPDDGFKEWTEQD